MKASSSKKKAKSHLTVSPKWEYHADRASVHGCDDKQPAVPVCQYYGCWRDLGTSASLAILKEAVSRSVYTLCDWQTFFCADHRVEVEKWLAAHSVEEAKTCLCHCCGWSILPSAVTPASALPQSRVPAQLTIQDLRNGRLVPLCNVCLSLGHVKRQIRVVSTRRPFGGRHNKQRGDSDDDDNDDDDDEYVHFDKKPKV